jgi:hypothetical protein
LPVRAAMPVLNRAQRDAEAHPSVSLLSGAMLLATRFVAAGKLAPADGVWHPDRLDQRDRDAVVRLGAARAYDGVDAAAATALVEQALAAFTDSLPRAAPARTRVPRAAAPTASEGSFAERIQQRVAERARRSRAEELPELVRISLRIEADEAAIEQLRQAGLQDDYAAAWEEWSEDEAAAWDQATADGLTDAAR